MIDRLLRRLEIKFGIEDPHPKSTPHNAKFISPTKVLATKHTGFCMDGVRQLSREHSHRHAVIYGASGTGKSKVVIAPSIMKISGSMIIFDPAGDLFRATAPYLADKKRYVVKRLNYAKPSVSDGFNPITYAKRRSQSGINQLSDLLVKIALGNQAESAYWNKNATNLLRVLMQIVLLYEPRQHTLTTIYHLISRLESDPGKLVAQVEASNNEYLISQFKGFLARDTKFRDYVATTLQAGLEAYADPNVALVSSFDSLELHRIRKRPMAIFVQVPPGQHEFYRVPNSIFWETVFAQLLEELPDKEAVPVYCLLDEVGWLSLPNLPTYMAVARKYFALLLALQDPSQLVANYGQQGAETIEANAWAKLFFTNASPKAAEALSRIMGTTEVHVQSQLPLIRPLMSHVDLRMMSPDRGVLLCGNLGPMKIKLRPYYTQKALTKIIDYSYAHPLKTGPYQRYNIPTKPQNYAR